MRGSTPIALWVLGLAVAGAANKHKRLGAGTLGKCPEKPSQGRPASGWPSNGNDQYSMKKCLALDGDLTDNAAYLKGRVPGGDKPVSGYAGWCRHSKDDGCGGSCIKCATTPVKLSQGVFKWCMYDFWSKAKAEGFVSSDDNTFGELSTILVVYSDKTNQFHFKKHEGPHEAVHYTYSSGKFSKEIGEGGKKLKVGSLGFGNRLKKLGDDFKTAIDSSTLEEIKNIATPVKLNSRVHHGVIGGEMCTAMVDMYVAPPAPPKCSEVATAEFCGMENKVPDTEKAEQEAPADHKECCRAKNCKEAIDANANLCTGDSVKDDTHYASPKPQPDPSKCCRKKTCQDLKKSQTDTAFCGPGKKYKGTNADKTEATEANKQNNCCEDMTCEERFKDTAQKLCDGKFVDPQKKTTKATTPDECCFECKEAAEYWMRKAGGSTNPYV